ncbi:MAG: ABC transporter ATP-binding protein [Flavisolibacter sp.]
MIKIENINKWFKKLQALNSINAEFKKGQVISLIGPNGSGKTTLIKSILGLVKPDTGNIFFNGEAITESVNYRSHIGYMPQIGRYPDNMKIGQLFKMIRNIREDKEWDEELYYHFKLDAILDKTMKSLSGGTRQKVSAALAFLFNSEVLILDEPTAGLDPLSSEMLKEKILSEKEKGKLILITSHVLSDLEELTTDVMYMQDGKLIINKSISELLMETGEQKLGKAIACLMKNGLEKKDVTYLKMATDEWSMNRVSYK